MSIDVNDEQVRPSVLYAQVELLIREEIARDGLQPGARLPTEAELCKRFGVSRSTIRQSLNRLEIDGLITRTRGKGTFVRRNNAVPSSEPAAAPGRHETRPALIHKMIGLVFCARSDTLQMNILLGAERAAKSRGYALMFGYSGEDQRMEEQEIERLLRMGTDGVIVMPVSNVTSTPGVQLLLEHRTPLVLVDRYLSDLDTSYVVSDGFDGAYRVTEHMIILGYESFSYITSGRELPSTTSVRDRYQGFSKALEDYGMAAQVKPLIPVNLNDTRDVERLITARTTGQTRPNAIVAVHDAVAIDLMRTATTIGLVPPDDYAVVGFDDLPTASHLPVPLTTVMQPRYDMGFKSGHMLIDIIEGRISQNEKLVLPVSLVVRESCGAHRIVAERARAREDASSLQVAA
ncbi:MAG: GntR family transcriptional regulator [Chloroflexi bacterium]|nr:GntR family transcriptional regulator [Chloroflexota bacterium]